MRMVHKASGGISWGFLLELEKFEIPNKDNKVVPLFWQGSNLIITILPTHIPYATLIAKDYVCPPWIHGALLNCVSYLPHRPQNKVNFVKPSRARCTEILCLCNSIHERNAILPYATFRKDLWYRDDLRSQEGLISSRHLHQLNCAKWRCRFYSNIQLLWCLI